MKRNVRYSLVLSALAFATFVVAGSPVARAESGSVPVNVSSRDALADDVAAYAGSAGLSEDEVLAYVAGEDVFAEQVNRLREKYPSVFVDAVWDGSDSSETAVYVNSKSVDFDNLTYGRLVYVDALSAEQRDALGSEVMGALVAELDLTSLSVNVDSLSGQLTAEYAGMVDEAQVLRTAWAAAAKFVNQSRSTENNGERVSAELVIVVRQAESAGLEANR